MTTSTHQVLGMTCEHCVRAVREEVGLLDGVRAVEVDLASGTLRVDVDPQVGTGAVRAAVEEAGYRLAP